MTMIICYSYTLTSLLSLELNVHAIGIIFMVVYKY